MSFHVSKDRLEVASPPIDSVANEVAPGSGIERDAMVVELARHDRVLLDMPDEPRATIEAWPPARKGQAGGAGARHR